MDRGRRKNELLANKNSILYMDLKGIIRNHALQFLPAKSLLRFTGVCRDWKLDITTPFFAHNQSNSFHDISGFFFQSGTAPPSFISLDPNAYGVPDPSLSFLPEPVEIRSSSNGLLCCQGRDGYKAYYICNPVTRKWTKLSKPNADHGHDPAIVLIFEPSLLNFVAEYKLVCAFSSVDFDNGYEFEIYSSREGSWRVSGEICFGKSTLLPRSGVIVNDIVYWQAKSGRILVFDLKMERAQQLDGRFGTLGMMDGKLCLTCSKPPTLVVETLLNPYANTMATRSFVKSWVTKYQINVSAPMSSGTGDGQKFHSVVFASGNVIMFRGGRKMHIYDIKSKGFKCVCDELDQSGRLVSHVNSLVEL